MPENKLVIKKSTITEISNIQHETTVLVLNDALITDDDIVLLIKLFPKDSCISTIRIEAHNLTKKSYEHFITLLKSQEKITSFYAAPIYPLTAEGSEFNGAIIRLLKKNKQLLLKEKLELSEISLQANKKNLADQPNSSIPPYKKITAVVSAQDLPPCNSSTTLIATAQTLARNNHVNHSSNFSKNSSDTNHSTPPADALLFTSDLMNPDSNIFSQNLNTQNLAKSLPLVPMVNGVMNGVKS